MYIVGLSSASATLHSNSSIMTDLTNLSKSTVLFTREYAIVFFLALLQLAECLQCALMFVSPLHHAGSKLEL